MVSLIIYSIKSALCLTVLYLPFSLFLRNEKRHRLNRIVLLSILAVSFIIPSIHIEWNNASVMSISTNSARIGEMTTDYLDNALSQTPMVQNGQESTGKIQSGINENAITAYTGNTEKDIASPQEQNEGKSMLPLILVMVYIIGTISVFLLRTIQIISLHLYIHRDCIWKRRLDDNATIYCHKGDIQPFSWMRSIVIGEKDASEPSYNAVVAHERAHVSCHHSADIIVMAIAETLQWFNPVLWMLRHDLCAIHEYEADEHVLRQGTQMKEYQLLLVSRLAKPHFLTVANGFSHTSLKSRIIMMLKDKSRRWTICKYLYIIPASTFALIAFASPKIEAIATEMEESRKDIVERIKESIKIPILEADDRADKDTEDLDLDNLKSVKAISTASSQDLTMAGKGQKMSLRNGYTVAFTNMHNDESTDYRLSVVDGNGNITDSKIIGQDSPKAVFAIESRACNAPDTLLTFDISEARDVDNWSLNRHYKVWTNSWLIKVNECHIDRNGKIHIGRTYMTSVGVNNPSDDESKQKTYPRGLLKHADLYKTTSSDKSSGDYTDTKRGMANQLSQKLRNEKVYTHADEAPVYNGSKRDIQESIGNILRADNRVKVRFIVRSDGTVTDVHCIGTLTAEQNKRVEDIFYTMPKWRPAKIDGKPVSMAMTMPLDWMSDKQHVTDPTRFLYSLYSSCIYALTPHGESIESNIRNAYFTDDMLSRMGNDIEKTLLDNSETDSWAERTLNVQPLEMNWYMVEYGKALFTKKAEYKHVAVHLAINNGRYVIDNILTSPLKDNNIRKYISSLIFDRDDMKPHELPSFKTLPDSTTNTFMRNVEGLGDRMAEITFMVYSDGSIGKVNIIDIKAKDEEPIEDIVKQRMKDKLESIKWKPGTAYGVATNTRMSMIATNTGGYLIR